MSRRALLGLGFLRVLPDELLDARTTPPVGPAGSEDGIAALKEEALAAWGRKPYRELGELLEPAAEALVGRRASGPASAYWTWGRETETSPSPPHGEERRSSPATPRPRS